MSERIHSVDALLLVSFGGPEGPDDVVPFLENVTRGRGIPRERLVEVGAHYAHFGGISPINALNRDLRGRLQSAMSGAHPGMPVLWGNRNWQPYLAEALDEARTLGVDRIFALLTSAYSSYSSCRQYRENLHDALAVVTAEHPNWAPQMHVLRPYWNHPGFVEPFVDGVRSALTRLPEGSRLVFTTHSLPKADSDRCDYLAQHRDVAAVVAASVGHTHWDLVYQSRSGPPQVPWLEPDIGDHLTDLAGRGVPGVVIVPIGFVSDHMEVIWDLDTVALQTAAALGLPAIRVGTPGADPRFVDLALDLLDEARSGVGSGGAEPVAVKWVGALGPRGTPCGPGCCPNPRGPRPAVCEAPEPALSRAGTAL